MIHTSSSTGDFNDPRRLYAASESIISIAELVPALVNELERIQQSDPTPRNARTLFVMRNYMENMLFHLHETRPELFGLNE